MNKEKLIDEIDWLISEIKPRLTLDADHRYSLNAVGVTCLQHTLSHASADELINTLKTKRENLI